VNAWYDVLAGRPIELTPRDSLNLCGLAAGMLAQDLEDVFVDNL
jgi:hypothetical protein